MTWGRFDDRYPISRKVKPLTDAAFRLDVEAILWSLREGTDGRVAADDLAQITAKPRPGRYAAELVQRGRWHEAGHSCPHATCPPSGPNGWVIHDYWDQQPTQERVLREKEAKAERQRKWIEAKKRGKDASSDASRDASLPPSRDASGDGAPRVRAPTPETPPRPAPPRRKVGREDPPQATADRRLPAGAGDGGREDQNHGGHPPSTNGRPTIVAKPPDLADVRAQLAAASSTHRAKANRRTGAFDALMAATELTAADQPPTTEPETTDA